MITLIHIFWGLFGLMGFILMELGAARKQHKNEFDLKVWYKKQQFQLWLSVMFTFVLVYFSPEVIGTMLPAEIKIPENARIFELYSLIAGFGNFGLWQKIYHGYIKDEKSNIPPH